MSKRSAALLISTIAAVLAFSATAANKKSEIGESTNVLVSASARTAANGIIGTGLEGIIGTGVTGEGIIGTGLQGIIGTGVVQALGIIGTG